jgi:hypothetical protein
MDGGPFQPTAPVLPGQKPVQDGSFHPSGTLSDHQNLRASSIFTGFDKWASSNPNKRHLSKEQEKRRRDESVDVVGGRDIYLQMAAGWVASKSCDGLLVGPTTYFLHTLEYMDFV